MSNSEMDKALWDLANAVTAFAILQTIAFVYATLQPEPAKLLAKPFSVRWIRRLTPVFATSYVVAIWGCFLCSRVPTGPDGYHGRAWILATIGRSIVVVLICLIPLLSTSAPRAD